MRERERERERESNVNKKKLKAKGERQCVHCERWGLFQPGIFRGQHSSLTPESRTGVEHTVGSVADGAFGETKEGAGGGEGGREERRNKGVRGIISSTHRSIRRSRVF